MRNPDLPVAPPEFLLLLWLVLHPAVLLFLSVEKDLRDIVQYIDTNNNKDYYNTFQSGLGAKMPKDMATVDIKNTK